MNLENIMHILAAFAVITFSVLGSVYMFHLTNFPTAVTLVSGLWLLIAWSVYEDFKTDHTL